MALVRCRRPERVDEVTVHDYEVWRTGDPRFAPSDDLAVARAHVEAIDPAVEPHTRAAMLAFVAEHPDALVRSCEPGHLTGSALVVDAVADRTLLLHHTKLQRWLQPGGHADGDANLPGVALREATEETGIEGLSVVVPAIDLDIHRVESRHDPAHDHLDVRYLVLAPAGAAAVGNHESTALAWVGPEDLAGLDADPGTVRLVHVGLALARRLRDSSTG
jgi:8-oxo-dGTP pyrophosphatase MutT (NUDIX family)